MQRALVWHDFDGGIELRVPGRHKGFVVDAVLSEMGRETAAAYLGDDSTDEDAFKAIRGRGIGVLVRPQYRATAADFWLKPPEELLEFLERWHELSGRKT
jgi:trehalose-phosphatase